MQPSIHHFWRHRSRESAQPAPFRRRPLNRFAVVLAAIIPGAVAIGDVVHLRDGSRRVGRIESSTSSVVSISTAAGIDEIRQTDVLSIESRAALRKSLREASAALTRGDWRAELHLARWALRKGMFEDSLSIADAALVHASTAGNETSLPTEFLPVPVLDVTSSTPIDDNVAWRLLLAQTDESHPATATVAAQRLLDRAPHDDVVAALVKGLKQKHAATRSLAAEGLGRSRAAAGYLPLLARLLLDSDRDVRFSALEGVKQYDDDPRLVPTLERGLTHPDARVRLAAVDAIDQLSETRTIGALIRNLKAGSVAPIPTGYSSDVEQRAFVSDFDVDVANSAFIANPNIGVLQSGNVLQASVLATSAVKLPLAERQYVGRVLARLTGADYGVDAKEWSRWQTGQRSGQR